MTQRRSTLAKDIQAALADDIVHGRIAPGQSLEEVRLAQVFGVSRTPVREALRQLEAIGLVEGRPHRGAVAADIPEERLDQMFVVMAEMEALCARMAAITMTPRERRALEEVHREGALLVTAHAMADYVAFNDTFHEAVYRGSHNDFLAEMVVMVRARVAPFRAAQFEMAGRLERSHAEHGRVVEAILRADGDAAATEMRRHILVVRTAVGGVTLNIPGHDRAGGQVVR